MKEIEEIAGKAGMPKGYMAFMDTDLKTLTQLHPELYHAVEEIGLDYFISSALPGRNRILYQGKSMIAFNLTPRNVCIGSPYVRMSVMEDIVECERTAPGWIMGVLDSPVVSFTPTFGTGAANSWRSSTGWCRGRRSTFFRIRSRDTFES